MNPKKYGAWTTEERIGKGGQAEVYKAHRDEGAEFCALKLIHFNRGQVKRRARFVQEMKKHIELTKKGADNIIPVIDHNLEEVEKTSKYGYIVMPMAETTLEKEIDVIKDYKIELCLDIFRGIVNGITGAHEAGIIHRDIKPANILFLGKPIKVPLVSDFGICFVKNTPTKNRITEIGETTGAKKFMAPEQERGGIVDVKESADVYALGKLLYCMLTGRYLYREELGTAFAPEQLQKEPKFKIILENILEKSIIKEPQKRIQTGRELLDIVDKVISRFGGSQGGSMLSSSQRGSSNALDKVRPDKILKTYSSYTDTGASYMQKIYDMKSAFDRIMATFTQSWEMTLSLYGGKPHLTEQAARELIDTQQESVGLTIAMARINAKEVFAHFKGLLEFITQAGEDRSGYREVLSVPYVVAGFLYMTANIAAFRFKSWDIFYLLINTKFQWHYQSMRSFYDLGFAYTKFRHPTFFHSHALEGKAPKSHDLYRQVLSLPVIRNDILRLDNEALQDIYSQVQMIMSLRCAQEFERHDSVRTWADFGRFEEHRVVKFLDDVYNNRQSYEWLFNIFNESAEKWFHKLNERLKVVKQNWFDGSYYFWSSIKSYTPPEHEAKGGLR
ncbi:MAG: serine/threonine-protein kinase [Candidatus Magnetobacterium sp. LHC-1]|uniref:Serine/threonine protein kinase n=1 Tax=Candidatus Magnetobacterium casense TaxID=1455061 RepID=A0ABS6RU02_9BACT|nr:serine/threonine-protein kinase [Candidatus Magnetobacterium casensis]MBF0608111.1 serine/threonine protein kinase [Nitrospirota bacterium]MBV6340093.1 serine/threonine protein kinase [Candidatus Magnetobacterium casensis]